MPDSKKATSAKSEKDSATPMIGSLLRLPREYVVARMLTEVNQQGFDVTDTELGVFMYPGPDGRRPIDLARQCNMTRQAMNYVLAGLERRGYIARGAGSESTARGVWLTDRGRDMFVLMRNCVGTIEQEWTAYLGAQRFNALRETLNDLSMWLGKVG